MLSWFKLVWLRAQMLWTLEHEYGFAEDVSAWPYRSTFWAATRTAAAARGNRRDAAAIYILMWFEALGSGNDEGRDFLARHVATILLHLPTMGARVAVHDALDAAMAEANRP